jgi:hypothetical protein
MQTEQITLPRFQAAIAKERPEGMPVDTHRRYSAGRVPQAFLRLLVKRPDLAAALLEDIRSISQQDR